MVRNLVKSGNKFDKIFGLSMFAQSWNWVFLAKMQVTFGNMPGVALESGSGSYQNLPRASATNLLSASISVHDPEAVIMVLNKLTYIDKMQVIKIKYEFLDHKPHYRPLVVVHFIYSNVILGEV